METGFLFALAALWTHLIQRAKRSESPLFKWIDAASDQITKWTAAFTALITSIGVSTVWIVDDVTHMATLSFGGIPTSWDQWGAVLVKAFTVYWFQKGYYLSALKPYSTGVAVDQDAKSPDDIQMDVKARNAEFDGGGR